MKEVSKVFIIDKPGGITSHDVVAKMRKTLRMRKIGHAGTLDPMATGMLLLASGRATRLLHYMVGQDKVYLARFRLGEARTTDDREGEILARVNREAVEHLWSHQERIQEVVTELCGVIQQVPSAVSAVRVNGKRAYELAREGREVELAARTVTVHRFEVGECELIEAEGGALMIEFDARIHCSSGTYIRALARDMGEKLGVYGHLTRLRRLSIGSFSLQAPSSSCASPYDHLWEGEPARVQTKNEFFEAELPVNIAYTPAEAAERILPVVQLTKSQTQDAFHGRRFRLHPEQLASSARRFTETSLPLCAARSAQGELCAILQIDSERNARVKTGFSPSA